ncbi:MAG TPA: hypothetical protein VF771_08620, partial [Longimicrobiaceae bacterium]
MARLTLRLVLLSGTLGALAAAPAAAQEQNIDRTVPARPGGTLRVDMRPGGSLHIEGWDRDEVRVEGTLGGRDWRDEVVTVERTSEGVELRVSMRREMNSTSTDNEFQVHVPRRYSVRLSSGGGELAVHDVRGDFDGMTGGGAIRLDDVSGTARLTTGGGAIHVSDSQLDGEVSTGGGNVEFRNVSGNIQGRTGGGSITRDDAPVSG